MTAIRNYGNTKRELNIAKERHKLLIDKKEALYVRYCGIKVPQLSADKVDGTPAGQDNMANYVHALTKINKKTGTSLEQDIEEQEKIIDQLEYYIAIMERNLEEMVGIEYDLYYAIVVDKKGTTESVEQVAFDTGKDVSTIWKYYYPKIEKDIKELEF